MRVLLKTIDARSDVININASVRIECVLVQSIYDFFPDFSRIQTLVFGLRAINGTTFKSSIIKARLVANVAE